MNIIAFLLPAILFFVLTPGILLRLPKNGNKYTVAAVHAFVFSALLCFMRTMFVNTYSMRDGFTDEACTEGNNEDGGPYMLEEDGTCKKIKPLDN
jgi:hypothetical protein